MPDEPFVSFVTPFYNTAAYLEECITSVLEQGYSNWEYVLLNNCSTDSSDKIAERYVRLFPGRIRLEHNASLLNQVQNYNRALQLISPRSKYCKVVQADDLIFSGCVQSMVGVAEAHPNVGIVGAYELEGDRIHLDGLPHSMISIPGREVCRLYFLRDRYLFGTPTSLLLRSELVRSRDAFYEDRLAPFEDAHVCFDLLRQCDFGFVHRVLTFTRRENESINSRWHDFKFAYLSRLGMVVVHGRNYLASAEYDTCLKESEKNYFRFLARMACARRQPTEQFWEFHRKGLEALGYVLDSRLLKKYIPRALVEKGIDCGWRAWDRIFSS